MVAACDSKHDNSCMAHSHGRHNDLVTFLALKQERKATSHPCEVRRCEVPLAWLPTDGYRPGENQVSQEAFLIPVSNHQGTRTLPRRPENICRDEFSHGDCLFIHTGVARSSCSRRRGLRANEERMEGISE